jgi:hypothetical protein
MEGRMTTLDKLAALGVKFADGQNEPTTTTVEVPDIAALRSLLDLGLDADGRRAHFDAMFEADGAEEDVVRQIAAHAVGDAQLSDSVQKATSAMFPLRVQLTAAPGPITVDSKKDLSTSDGTPSVVVFTDVTMNPGGYFYCSATTLSFTCDTLTRNGTSGVAGDFLVVGATGATPPKPATPGAAGQAQSGGPGQCSSGGIAGPGGGNGTHGNPGTPGTPGSPGGTGIASQAATIMIKNSLTASNLVVHTQSGPGGTGGEGGDGGKGQQGGNGGNGVTCGCTGNGGGTGADGGLGGKGGRAGDGGNGINASGGITVYVPTNADIAKVIKSPQPAPPGQPGNPGNGGTGGDGGAGSSGGKYNGGGGGGGTGGPGGPGDQGNAGTVPGQPAAITVLITP